MKQKNKKIVFGIVLGVILAIIAALAVIYSLYPVQTKQAINTAWAWLNQPLPVVGFSILFLVIFFWRVFASTSFGKRQINQFKRNVSLVEEDFDKLKDEFREYQNENECEKEKLHAEIRELKDFIKKVITAIPNKKVKQLGVTFYGEGKETEERTNNETEAE